MRLKEELISELKKREFSPKIFGEVPIDIWNQRIQKAEDYSMYFDSDMILYYEQFYNSKAVAFWIEHLDSICLFKFYITDEQIFLYPLCFEDSFNYSKGVMIAKYVSSFFEKKSLKLEFMNLPFSNNLINYFKLKIHFIGAFKTCIEMYINVKDPLEELWSVLRKSYKSLINFGKKTLKVESEFSDDLWNDCKTLHMRVAGRKTRNDKTWDIQKTMIEKNKAKIFYIYEEGKILGFAFFTISNNTGVYSVAAYDRSKFDKISISHVIIWHAIEYFKSIGFDNIYLGEYAPEKHINNQKLGNINHFKLGFCNTLISNNYLSNE